MFKRLLTLTICMLASSGLALASEPGCPPITVVVPTAVRYTVQNCVALDLTPGMVGCLNCPGEEAHILNRTHPVCVQGYRDYVTRTLVRHLVNGRCVPIEIALRAQTPPQRTQLPRAVAPPMPGGPVSGPRVRAPRAPAAPQWHAPAHVTPAAAPPAQHAVPQGGRPKP